MKIQIQGTLTASDSDKREVTYLLLPYGEEGRTSAGKITASAGSVTIPEDVSKVGLNFEHDFTRPVGKATLIEETEAGLLATFKIARTSAGNDLLVEIEEGLRAAASVEVEDPVIRNGALVAGTLTGAGAVVRPAFPSAQAQLVACDCGDLPSDSEEEPEPESTEATEAEETPKEEVMEANTNAAAPADLMVASNGGAAKGLDLSRPYDIAKLVAGFHATGKTDRALLAALSDVTQTGVYDPAAVPQYIGELWANRSYQQKYAPLIGHDNLTAMKIVSWQFVTTPQVGDYSGNKAAIPSNAVTTEAVEFTAARLAAGWDVDRIMVDFPNPEFWSAFFKAATDDYARKIDAKVLTHLKSNSTAVTGVGADPVDQLIEGAIALDAAEVGVPTFAIMGTDVYKTYLATTQANVAVFLSQALGLKEGSFEGFKVLHSADSGLTGKTLVGTKAASTLFELGGSPIRVSALDLANGGVDEALFGYYALVHHGEGLVIVS